MKLYVRSVNMQGDYTPNKVEITGVVEGADAFSMIHALAGAIDLGPLPVSYERLDTETICVDGKYYRQMTDAECANFIWGVDKPPQPGTEAYWAAVTSKDATPNTAHTKIVRKEGRQEMTLLETMQGVAARIWCDQDYSKYTMNADLAQKIAGLLAEEAERQDANPDKGNSFVEPEFSPVILARRLRLAVIKSMWIVGEFSEDDAKELLAGPLVPGDLSTVIDDSAFLNDPDGLSKISA